MKRWLSILTIVSVAGAIIVQDTSRAQLPASNGSKGTIPADLGPGEQGATLKQPGLEAPGQPSPSPSPPPPPAPAPGALPGWLNRMLPATNAGAPHTGWSALPPSNRTNINADIEVKPENGAWLLLVMTYSGDNAPQQARKFVSVLKNTYKINGAYIFNYGAEEKRKEYERANAEREKQREAIRRAGLTLTDKDPSIRVLVSKIDEHTGVLIGGFRTRDEALLARDKIRALDPNPLLKNGVDLDMKFVGTEVTEQDPFSQPRSKILVQAKENAAYVNPFQRALPVRNPCLPPEQAKEDTAADIAYLREANAGETLSLFHCKKPYTLAIKQFKTAMVITGSAPEAKGFLDKLAKKNVDYAAQNARNLCEYFRKAGLPESYVLHSRFCSYVTVGGYDRPDDPNLLGMQNFLEGKFKSEPSLQPLELMPRPLPMQVPH